MHEENKQHTGTITDEAGMFFNLPVIGSKKFLLCKKTWWHTLSDKKMFIEGKSYEQIDKNRMINEEGNIHYVGELEKFFISA